MWPALPEREGGSAGRADRFLERSVEGDVKFMRGPPSSCHKRLRRECSVESHEVQPATVKDEMECSKIQQLPAEHSDGRPVERQEKKSVPVEQRTPRMPPVRVSTLVERSE